MATLTEERPSVIRFASFEVNLRARELRRNRRKINLQQQPFEILATLLERPGELVTREELRERLWPGDTFVDFDHGINSAIRRLRDALGDSAENSRFVQTLGRRGYRLAVPASELTYCNGTPRAAQPVATPVVVPALEATTDVQEPSSIQRRSGMVWAAALAVFVVILSGASYWWTSHSRARSKRLDELQQLRVVPLTVLPGSVASPTYSPDGSEVAFAWEEDNGKGYDLYVKVVGSDVPLRLTHHSSRALSLAWSPDGRTIAFERDAGEDDSGIYVIAPTGGPERKLAARSPIHWLGRGMSWSRDGQRLAYIERASTSGSPEKPELFGDSALQLVLLSVDTLEKTTVPTGCFALSSPAFSPGGTYLSWVCNKGGHSASLWLMRLKYGTKTQLLTWDDGIWATAWSKDEQRIVFSPVEGYGALWELAIQYPKHVVRLPVGRGAGDLAMNPAGPGLVYQEGDYNFNIWRLNLQTEPLHADKVVASSLGQRSASLSPDGRRIAFESNRSGSGWEVWVCDADGSNPQQLTFLGRSTTGTPRWSPDGQRIVFDSRGAGDSDLYVIDAKGGVPQKLNIDLQDNALGSWSHDGQWLYFVNGEDHGKSSVWKAPSSGGHAMKIADHAYFPLVAPDGDHVYFVRDRMLWRARSDGTVQESVVGMPQLDSMGDEWFPFQSGIYFIAHEGDRSIISRFDLRTRKVQSLYETEKSTPDWIGGLPVSPDGSYLLYTQVDERSSKLMLIQNWQ